MINLDGFWILSIDLKRPRLPQCSPNAAVVYYCFAIVSRPLRLLVPSSNHDLLY